VATCDVCGRKLALMGKSAAKNRGRVAGLVGALRHLQTTVLTEAQSEDDVDANELARFQSNTDRLIRDGEHYADLLHRVSHDSGYPGVNYGAIKHWMDTSVSVLNM
jgi:hypothetical protein